MPPTGSSALEPTVGRFQFKNIEVPQADEAEGKVEYEFLGVGSGLVE
jgi:hypothetical protein